jgi:hypothetical protein
MAKEDGPMTSAMLTLIDREVEVAMRRLKIASRTALMREVAQYSRADEEDYHRCLPAGLFARVQSVELMGTILHESALDSLEYLDQWIVELRELLPQAVARPLTKGEMRAVLVEVTRDKEERVARERQRMAEVGREIEAANFLAEMAGVADEDMFRIRFGDEMADEAVRVNGLVEHHAAD